MTTQQLYRDLIKAGFTDEDVERVLQLKPHQALQLRAGNNLPALESRHALAHFLRFGERARKWHAWEAARLR